MSNISMKVEFLAGTSLKAAVTEARSMARQMDIAYVKFKFNGIKISIGQYADVDYVINEYGRNMGEWIVSA